MLYPLLAYIGPGVGPSSSGDPVGLWLAFGTALTLMIAFVLRRSQDPQRRWTPSLREFLEITLFVAVLELSLLFFLVTILIVAAWPTIAVSVVVLALIWTLIWMGLPWRPRSGWICHQRLVVKSRP